MRAHYVAPIQSVAGALQTGAVVSIFANGSTANGTQQGTLISQPVYADGTSPTLMTNPFICTSGDANFYLPYPTRVDLGIQVPGQAPVYFPDVDVDTNNGLIPTVVTASYLVSLSDQWILASAASAPVTLTLPTAIMSLEYLFKRTDNSGNVMAIAAQAGQFIDGQATLPLTAYGRARLGSDGAAWWQI